MMVLIGIAGIIIGAVVVSLWLGKNTGVGKVSGGHGGVSDTKSGSDTKI